MKEEFNSQKDSLAARRPDVTATWSLKNSPQTPEDFTVNSHKSVWWLEDCGHEFMMPIARRTGRKLSCKICSGQELLVGFNDLATTHPDLVNEWDFTKNDEVTPSSVQQGSQYIVWWLGKNCGHSWDAKVSSRTRSKPTGCPVCKNLRVIAGVNDLATHFPEIAKEFDFSSEQQNNPQNTSSGSEKILSWTCQNGHSYKASPYSRTVKGTGCPVCKNLKIVVGVNDLLTVYPEIAKEWDYEKNLNPPTDYSFGSHSKVWFVCSNRHSYQTVIRKRSDGNGCPYCGKKLVLKGFNDLETEFPQITAQWDLELSKKKPSEVISGSISRAWFKCLGNKGYGGSRPRRCSTKDASTRLCEPMDSYPGSKKSWKCKHLKCGEIVFPRYSKVMQSNGGCITCKREKIKFDPSVALEIMRKVHLEPLVPYESAQIKWESKCLHLIVEKSEFDSVATLYASAHPVGWGVVERRFGFPDSALDEKNLPQIHAIADWVFDEGKSGKKVLVRCLGWNRSGLVTALALDKEGYEPRESIALMRERRSSNAL